MDKAIIEKKDAYIIGEKLRNYKLARGLFDNTVWGLELFHGGQNIHQLRFPEKDVRRVEKYMKTLCRGLYIRSNPNSNPVSPELSWLQYVAGSLNGTGSRYLEAVKTLVNSSSKYLFGQRWGNQLFYIGSRCAETDSAGFLFIQFYSQLGVLAFFDKKSS